MVQGASQKIHLYAQRGAWAVIHDVQHAVLVFIHGATTVVHHHPEGRTGAHVQAVGNSVAVGIFPAEVDSLADAESHGNLGTSGNVISNLFTVVVTMDLVAVTQLRSSEVVQTDIHTEQ